MNAGAGAGFSDRIADGILATEQGASGLILGGHFKIEVLRDDEIIDFFAFHNLIVNQGLNYVRDVSLLDGTKIAAWYVALIDGSPTIAAGDTYAAQAGWNEVTAYDEATRPAWTGVAGAVGVATNSAARAEFTIATGGATVGGVAIVGGGTDPTVKGDTAGGGTLLSASTFTGGNRVLQAADLLRITWQLTGDNA